MKSKIIILIMLVCIMCPQIVAYGSNEFTDIANGIEDIYTVNSSGDLIFYEVSLYEYYCQNVEFMKAYIFERSNKKSRENVAYIGYHRVTDLGKAARYLFFVPDDESVSLSDIIACPKSDTFNQGNYMEFYNKNTGLVVKGTIYSFNNSANEIGGKEQISMQYNSRRIFCTIGGEYFIDCPKELLLSNIKIYGYDNDIQLSSSQCKEILDNAVNGSIEADNETSFLPKRYGVLEAPRDIKFSNDRVSEFLNAHVDISFSWSQTDENYKLWDTEILVYVDFKYRINVFIFGDWHRAYGVFAFDDVVPTKRLKYSFNEGEMTFDNPAIKTVIIEDIGNKAVQYSTEKLEIFIRNKYSDNEYTYYSNWVKLTITSEGAFYDDDDYKNGSITGEEYIYDDIVNGDGDVDFSINKPSGSINPDSPYQGGVLGSYLDGFDLSDALSNGFGLAGENGIIEMFQDLFSFVPDSIWSLIVSGIIVLISIALLKAVF